jgi:hypothetical protein
MSDSAMKAATVASAGVHAGSKPRYGKKTKKPAIAAQSA